MSRWFFFVKLTGSKIGLKPAFQLLEFSHSLRLHSKKFLFVFDQSVSLTWDFISTHWPQSKLYCGALGPLVLTWIDFNPSMDE